MKLLKAICTLMHKNNVVRRGKILDAAHDFLLFIWLQPTLLTPCPRYHNRYLQFFYLYLSLSSL
jgi:hypothetical protein